MTQSRKDHVRFSGATQVLDDESITAIIPLDELEARLEAAYTDSWTDAADTNSALIYHPSSSEVTQDLMIPEALLTSAPEFDEPLDEAEDTALLAEPELAPEPLRAPVRRGGKHRVPAAPHALKGRAALLALAAGASVAAGAVSTMADQGPSTSQQPVVPPTGAESNAVTTAPLAAAQDMDQFAAGLAAGKASKDDDDRRIIDSMRPKAMDPVPGGAYTSNFGMRWGTMHNGVDLAAPLGTPILAATDGTVVEAGPASGFGIWIQVKQDDGTIIVYGHMYNVNVQKGQKVRAGDLISWVGNNGQSFGPHCHVEVWLGGTQKIDPQPWFAERGVNIGRYVG